MKPRQQSRPQAGQQHCLNNFNGQPQKQQKKQKKVVKQKKVWALKKN
jgi:hypothetical protein